MFMGPETLQAGGEIRRPFSSICGTIPKLILFPIGKFEIRSSRR
jgi:hypothetical protein